MFRYRKMVLLDQTFMVKEIKELTQSSDAETSSCIKAQKIIENYLEKSTAVLQKYFNEKRREN